MKVTLASMHEDERLTQLLLDRALQGLDNDESAELHALVHDDSELEAAFDPGRFEQAAAMAAIALLGVNVKEELPLSMRARLSHAGSSFARTTPLARIGVQPAAEASDGSLRLRMWAGWIAAAACLVIALLAWMPLVKSNDDPATLRAQLIAAKPNDLIQWNWSAGNDPANTGVSGDIVWSDAEQRGYMRFAGLAKNDPTREQYQLWIFDKQRKAEYPVDGGVFDVTADGEVIIPINAKLNVFEANMFAVTVEKPGGVARSERERIPVLAQPPA